MRPLWLGSLRLKNRNEMQGKKSLPHRAEVKLHRKKELRSGAISVPLQLGSQVGLGAIT